MLDRYSKKNLQLIPRFEGSWSSGASLKVDDRNVAFSIHHCVFIREGKRMSLNDSIENSVLFHVAHETEVLILLSKKIQAIRYTYGQAVRFTYIDSTSEAIIWRRVFLGHVLRVQCSEGQGRDCCHELGLGNSNKFLYRLQQRTTHYIIEWRTVDENQ